MTIHQHAPREPRTRAALVEHLCAAHGAPPGEVSAASFSVLGHAHQGFHLRQAASYQIEPGDEKTLIALVRKQLEGADAKTKVTLNKLLTKLEGRVEFRKSGGYLSGL